MAKIIPLDDAQGNPLQDLQRLAELKGYGENFVEGLKEALMPYKIKLEGRLLPDWLITVKPQQESGFIKFVKDVFQPRVYILTNSGYAFGIDLRSGKVFKVTDFSVFQPGTFQQLVSNPITLALLGFGIGMGTYYLIKKLREG